MGWYCVHIEHVRVAKAINATFRKMLIDEHRAQGLPRDCHIYFNSGPGGHFYYFSPAAAEALKFFIIFWEGFGVSEPTLWNQMEKLI